MTVANYKYADFYNNTGGINTVKSAILLDKSECRDSQNMDYFPIGGFTKRNGYVLLDSAFSPDVADTNAVTGLFMSRYTTAGGTNVAYRVSGTKIYKMTGLDGTWTDISGVLTITTGATNIWNFAQLNNITVLGNGTDTPIQISSSSVASALNLTTLTIFKFCVESRGYMWYFQPTVGGTVQYDRGYFSDINDPTTVQTNNFVNFSKGSGGIMAGAVDYKGSVYVFKEKSIHQAYFQPTAVDSSGTLFPWIQFPNPVVPGVGTRSHRSICKFTTPETHATPGQEFVFFVDQYGCPRIFDGTTTISFFSKIGTSRDTTILSLSNMDTTRTSFAFSINYPMKNKILIFLSRSNSQQDTCWVLDYSTGFAIGRYKYALAFNTGFLFEKTDGTFKPYVGSYGGKVFQLDQSSSDNGTAINDYYTTGDTYQGSPSLNSKWFFMNIRGQTGSDSQQVKTSFFLDGSDTPSLSDTKPLQSEQTIWGVGMIWGESSWATKSIKSATSEIGVDSKTLRTKVESLDKLNDTLTVEGFSLASQQLGTSDF